MSFRPIFYKEFQLAGFDVHVQDNVYQSELHIEYGWNLKLPEIEFKKNTVLLLQLQDFLTIKQGKILELEKIEQNYKDNSQQVIILHWPHALGRYYNGSLNFLEFNFHSYNIIKNLKKRWLEWQHLLNCQRSYAWQCLNGRNCWHRRQVVDILKNWPNGILSFGIEIPLAQSQYSDYKFDNEDNFIRLANVYGSCNVNIVTETQYDCVPGIITEKTLMAMLSEQIPIVIGYPGIVADCKSLGYDMFDDIVDTSYDNLPDNVRAAQALELNRDLIQGKISLLPYRERLRAQREFILNDYMNLMEMRLQRDCQKLISRLSTLLSI